MRNMFCFVLFHWIMYDRNNRNRTIIRENNIKQKMLRMYYLFVKVKEAFETT